LPGEDDLDGLLGAGVDLDGLLGVEVDLEGELLEGGD
jgi:hypothetical protein